MNLRQLALVGLTALALGGTAVAQVAQPGPATAVTPPPPPAPNGNAATPGTLIGTPAPATTPSLDVTIAPTPAASSAPAGRRGRRPAPAASPQPGASPSESPEPPQFQTMDGVWEVQLQPFGSYRAIYSHLSITQKGDQLSGTWIRTDKDKLAFSGTFDGRLFKLSLKGSGTESYTMAGYAENFGDMVGLLTSADPKDRGVPFTASHRKKDKPI